jgi:hypothetical protein
MSGFRVFMQVETTIGAALLAVSLVCQTLYALLPRH